MNEINSGAPKLLETGQPQHQIVAGVASNSRRRLIKLGSGAVPVIATLASQPALAWHCNTPSAWGSQAMNPNASTSARNDSKALGDETWGIANWIGNTTRAGLPIPWDYLISIPSYSGLKVNNVTNIWDNTKKKWIFNYTLVKISLLASVVKVNCANATTSSTVVSVLGGTDDFLKRVITAQLISICAPSSIANCLVSLNDLKAMANLTFKPPNATVPWTKLEVATYLKNNYIAY